MATRDTRFHDARPFILWPSLLGLGMVAIIAGVNVANGDVVRALVLTAILGWPFALGMLALVLRGGTEVRRWFVLLAALGAAAVAVPTVFGGIGWWFGVIAIAYAWAWWSMRPVS